MEKFTTISEQIEYLEILISTGNYKIERKGKFWYSLQNENLKYEVLYIQSLKELTIKNLLNEDDIHKIRFKYSDYTNDDFIVKTFFRNLFSKFRYAISDNERNLLLDIEKLYKELKNSTSEVTYKYNSDELYKQVKKWIETYSLDNNNILIDLKESFRKERNYIKDSSKNMIEFISKANERIKRNIKYILDLAEDLQ